jgi:stage IV sporulation protein B
MRHGKRLFFPLIFALFLSVASLLTETNFAVPVSSSANQTMVIPGGKSIGVTLCTNGVMVTGLSEISLYDGKLISPAKDAGIKAGDIIKFFNDEPIGNVSELSDAIQKTNVASCPIVLSRDNKTVKTTISPEISADDGQPKIGAWVKDAASGIGTITFYNPETRFFAALGHGICDVNSGKVLDVSEGEILSSTIVSVDKGKKGSPGELNGVFSENSECLGHIKENRQSGICGTVNDKFYLSHTPVCIAKKEEIKTGSAYILANVEGNLTEKFDIEIIRIISTNDTSLKNMVIKITDEKLLEKTGGIVQGMSGCPIIQNNKLVGAVTHTFVNDPAKGYGIFIENMLNTANVPTAKTS